MKVYIVDQDGEILFEIVCKAKTIRGIKSELKRTSFAMHTDWKIRIEDTVRESVA